METIVYHYRGEAERGENYAWKDVYSETCADGSIAYPWHTREGCIADASERGAAAAFD
jgi:hypothetical protein